MDEPSLPPSALSFGGRFGYDDDGQTPNTQLVLLPYVKAPLYFEVRGLPSKVGSKEMDNYRGSAIGLVLQYERGHVLIPAYNAAIAFDDKGEILQRWGRYSLPGEVAPPAAPAPAPGSPLAPTHYSNFISAVRTRNAKSLACNAREGEVSSALCHLAGISHRLGTLQTSESALERVQDEPVATEALGRMLEHLKLNDALPEKLTLGALLKIDAQREEIMDNPAATALSHRKDRAPFSVPKMA